MAQPTSIHRMNSLHDHDVDRYWSSIAELPLQIDSCATSQLALDGATSFTRRTTIVELHGDGLVGRGENISYSGDVQLLVPAHVAQLPLTGSWTLDSFRAHLDTLELVPPGDRTDGDHPNYHRWALKSAALDLALLQADSTLAGELGTSRDPIRFCLSMGLGSPPSTDTIVGWLAHEPSTTFKIDSSREWNELVCEQLATTRAVRVVDFKGHYTGDWIDNAPDPDLYGRVARTLPDVILEDPMLTEETLTALGADGIARHAWDAPVHSLEDAMRLVAERRPRAMNIKPSRFGSVRELLRTIAWCGQEGIPMYGGGQYELGWGRTQIQDIAATFYPEAANDVAPVVFHGAAPASGMPTSPLTPVASNGFGWDGGVAGAVV